ncbi:MAG: GPW/gp25 family protein [Nannocystaceae bacterium]
MPRSKRPSLGLLAQLRGDTDAPTTALARTLDLALDTRPGEAASDPSFGLPCFADVVHGDRAAAQALRIQLLQALRSGHARLPKTELRVSLDRRAALLHIELREGDAQRGTRACVDALGVAARAHESDAGRQP